MPPGSRSQARASVITTTNHPQRAMSNATTTEDKRAALIACITSNADARSAALLRTAEMFEGDDALSAEYLRHAAGSDRIDFISAVIRACFKVLA